MGMYAPFLNEASRYLGVLLLMLVLSGCSSFAEPIELSSEHFLFVGTNHTTSKEEMRYGIQKAEALYQALKDIIPANFPMDSVVVVQLNGPVGSQSPYVDGEGTIQLWRYSAEEGGYWALFAHELVHAVAFDTAVKAGALEWESLGFYNEGWAEYAAQLINPEKTGFPWYGFDEAIVAGYWLSQGGPSLAELRTSHQDLNLKCSCQAYPLRASWFRYIDETYGRRAILNIMYGGREMVPEVVEEILGDSLEKVDEAWHTWVLKSYAKHSTADAHADSYRKKIGWYQPCL